MQGPPAAASDLCGPRTELVALTSTNLYHHHPHDPLQKGIVFQDYFCILDSEQSGNGPKIELCPLSDKI
jgi:hypothetical protein